MALARGNIAFVGWNADGNDNLAFVALVDIAAGESITFEDNEWNGTAWVDTNEGAFTWQASVLVPAGTIVTIDSIGAGTASASTGILTLPLAGRGGNRGLAAADEVVYAYQGSAAAPTFLTAIANSGFDTTARGLLTGTGLTAGLDALDLSSVDTGADIAAYNGPRSGQANFAAYLASLNNPANWITQDATGDQSIDAIAPDVPFASTVFSIATPTPAVELAVSANAGSEAGATAITVTVTASAPVTGAQSMNLGVSGTGITAADYLLSASQIVIADGQTQGSVTFTVVDDALVEGLETATLTLSAPSSGISLGTITSQNVSIADNDVGTTVNLSVSAGTATESGATTITVTATASAPVAGNQTVFLGVSGSGITSGDYYLTSSTITIPNGQTSGSVSFIVADDAIVEGTEVATLGIGTPSAGLVLGPTITQTVSITNNDASFLTKLSGAVSTTASEIPAFDPASDRLYVVAASTVNVYLMATDGSLSPQPNLSPGFTPPAGTAAAPNSVAVRDGIVAVAYQIADTTTNAQLQGRVSFFNAADGSFLNSVAVGNLPDMLTFTPDGRKVLVANEGEPNSYNQATSFDPEGSVSIIDLSAGVTNATVQTAGFSAFNAQVAALRAAGVRIFGPNASVAQDLEPEYITVMPGGATAMVTLQEANAIGKLDIASATFTEIIPLGVSDHSLPGNGMDASDRDVNGTSAGGGRINIQNWPVVGLYQPDAIASFSVAGNSYVITANEGDSRSYTGYSEEIRVGAAGYVLDPTTFPNAATLKLDANLGRLQLTNATGDTNADGDFDRIESFGARSFSIRDASGALVYDSADLIERVTALRTPTLFNSDGSAASFDSRSDNKGPEPEGVVIGTINTSVYAFVGLERVGDILVFEVTNPQAPRFIQYINTPEDVAVEGLSFVPAADSPTGKPLLITANEVSNTVAVFQISAPLHIRDIQGSGHLSPYAGQAVRGVTGIVTAVAPNGFYLQDPTPDSNPATSEGIFVFTTNAAILSARSVGEALQVSGTVSEFRPGGNANNLTVTEIVNSNAVQPLVVTPWTGAPSTPIAPTVLGAGGRTIPSTAINDDGTVNVELAGDFSPATEGIDFFESLEGMLVQISSPVATSPTAHFGTSEEIWVLADDGLNASGRTNRGGSLISAGDFNPERLQIDDLNNLLTLPDVDVGARLGTVVGVLGYDFSNYEVLVPNAPTIVQASSLAKEQTHLAPATDKLTVATFNVENLDPADGAAKFAALAAAIVGNLRSPDILTLEEMQDNNGAVNDGTVSASLTFQTLISAIASAGGPTYQYRQIDPVNNQDGGEPGGNIRVGFLFNPARVGFDETSLQRLTDTQLADGDAFASSRKPLVGTFSFNGESVTVIANHFNSKGGDQPLFGVNQPPVLSSEVQRLQQATIVSDYVQGRLATDPNARIIVAGDLNDFEFSNPLGVLESAGLTTLIETLPAPERYTYNFEGNAQVLDQILASGRLRNALDGFDVVHINSEFADQISDHDPSVARFLIERAGQVITGNAARNTLTGTDGADTITGLQGRDLLTGGAGADRFVYTSLLDAGDRITDFQVGYDRLVVDAMLARLNYTGSDPVGDGYIGVLDGGVASTFVTVDPDGSAGAAIPRVLVELNVDIDSASVLFF